MIELLSWNPRTRLHSSPLTKYMNPSEYAPPVINLTDKPARNNGSFHGRRLRVSCFAAAAAIDSAKIRAAAVKCVNTRELQVQRWHVFHRQDSRAPPLLRFEFVRFNLALQSQQNLQSRIQTVYLVVTEKTCYSSQHSQNCPNERNS